MHSGMREYHRGQITPRGSNEIGDGGAGVSSGGDSPGMKVARGVARDVAIGVIANVVVEVIKRAIGVPGGSGGSSS